MLEAGHAENALPQSAKATVNCRVLPTEDPADVQRILQCVVGDDQITFTPLQPLDQVQSPPTPLRADVMEAVKTVTAQMWPGVPVVPFLSQGATDARLLRSNRIPTFGLSGVADDFDDIRWHGKDERIFAAALYEAREFMYLLVKALSPSSR